MTKARERKLSPAEDDGGARQRRTREAMKARERRRSPARGEWRCDWREAAGRFEGGGGGGRSRHRLVTAVLWPVWKWSGAAVQNERREDGGG
ncbi:unnamed protein product [Linum trigynum]|uniref:Uncharacterized protein n=1 Tax=Linum trigynum TaxID=586398 RepID=A0AAV2FTS8_9ROSI